MTDKDGVGGGGEMLLLGEKKRLTGREERERHGKMRIREWSYQTTPLVHTKIIVLPMVSVLCLFFCV